MNTLQILKKAKTDKVQFVDLQFSDLHGTAKSVTIPIEHLQRSLTQGTWFDGSSIEGFARICESDMFLKPDPNTYAVIPWQNDGYTTARFICDIHKPDGDRFEGDPRYILQKAVAEAGKLGYTFMTGPELEFFLFTRENGKIKPLTHDQGSYFDLNMDHAYSIRKSMVQALQKMNINVEMGHHECAAGQHEIDFRYDNALTTADNAFTLKFTLKAVAEKYGLYCTFMPKPITGINGSGMHVHQSLFKGGENAFFDAKDPYHLSKIAYNYIAGQLAHVKAISAIAAPTVNSYKRLVPGYEAPVYICWARINRSALIRVPSTSKGSREATRIELRCPDPSCNPYLAFAVMLHAGLDGIRRNLSPAKPVEEDVYDFRAEELYEKKIDTLPHSLWQALDYLKKDKVIIDAIGDHTYQQFIRAKTDEWDECRTTVTEWELNKYLEIV